MVEVSEASFERPILYVGRYAIFNAIARGGFASVHLARSFGAGNFARTVAIKRLHRQYAQDPEVGAMFLDEAHLVARIRHPNVLPTLDLIADDDELMIVMEYVEGVTLRYLMRYARNRNRKLPLKVVLRIMVSALRGLHAAHEARDAKGERLNITHRDVAPDNILIGTDGLVRILDFGVAKALGQYHDTRAGEVRGKLAYMTPEQVNDEPVSHRSDLFSAAIVLWEAMTGERLFAAKSVTATAHKVLTREIPLPSDLVGTPKKLDGIVLQGLERDPGKRWPSAERFAAALEAVGSLASEGSLAQYVRQAGADRLRERARQVEAVEAADVDIEQLELPARASMTTEEIREELAKREALSAPPPAPSSSEELDVSEIEVVATPPKPPPTAAVAAPEEEKEPARKDTPTDLGTWSEPPPPQQPGGLRAVLPVVAGLLVLVIVVLLLTGDETDTKSPEGAAVGPVATDSESPPPTRDPEPAVQPSATTQPSSKPSSTVVEAGSDPTPPPEPKVVPKPPAVPNTWPRPKQPPPAKPPPLYGRE